MLNIIVLNSYVYKGSTAMVLVDHQALNKSIVEQQNHDLCNTWRIDRDEKIENALFNIFQGLFPQNLLEAGSHISLSDILDKKIGLH